MVRVEQVFEEVFDILAASYLLRSTSSDDETTRMLVGITAGGLGYYYGPKVQQKLQKLGQEEIFSTNNEFIRSGVIYTLGGALLGAAVGHAVPPLLKKLESVPKGLEERLKNVYNKNSMLMLSSAGWLGYSLFLSNKTKQARDQHLWGLGAGAIGYLYAPELLGGMKHQVIPKAASDHTMKIYTTGFALAGGLAGAAMSFGRQKYSEEEYE